KVHRHRTVGRTNNELSVKEYWLGISETFKGPLTIFFSSNHLSLEPWKSVTASGSLRKVCILHM
ncbi:unnamed protein product, partial [Ceratitis capitata]